MRFCPPGHTLSQDVTPVIPLAGRFNVNDLGTPASHQHADDGHGNGAAYFNNPDTLKFSGHTLSPID
jgi:hypothetical protein